MFWHRTLKVTGTFIGYGFASVGGGIGAAFIAVFCLGAMNIEVEDNPIVPIAGIGTGGVIGIMGLRKTKEYATCSISEDILSIKNSEIVWKKEYHDYTIGNQTYTETRNIPYTRMNLEGINDPFHVRGDFRDCQSVKMRLYCNDEKNCIIDWDFICGYKA
jgi:hypothetical protein